jgi:hypothetical protein
VLMFAVLSAGMLTGLTATGMSLGQTAFAHEGKKYDKDQTIDQENHCKLVIQNDNNNHLTCQNLAQNAKSDASIDGNPFSGSNYGNPFSGSN